MMKRMAMFAAAALVSLGTVLAQPGGGGGGWRRDRGGEGGRAGGPGGPGGMRFDPQRMQEMMLNRMKEVLEFGDEDWDVIKPYMQAVFEKQQKERELAMGGMRMMMMMGPGPQRGDMGEDNSPAEIKALSKALEGEDLEAIKAAMTALRKARKQRQEELRKAQEELRELLTAEQEARLLLMGTLE